MFSGGIDKQYQTVLVSMSKYGRKLYIYRKKDTRPSQKIIQNHLQNRPNFHVLPPHAGSHKQMTAVDLFM